MCGFGDDRSRRASAIGNEENFMLVLNGSASIADVVALADRREQVSVSARVIEAVDHAHRVAADLSTRFAIYGRTTGVGANRTTSVSPTDTEYGMRLLRSHAVDAGDPLDDRTVRAMLAVRLAQLCVPGAGLDPKILAGLETMLNDDALPELRQYASIGTGDLAPLAGTALTLIGERPASKPLTPMEPWGADSALPFMSSSALTVGRGCLALDELSRLERASSVIYMLSFLALDGNPEALSSVAAQASAAPYVDTVADRLRSLLATKGGPDRRPARIQDPYGLRVYPVAQATVAGVLAFAGGTTRADTQRRAGESPLRHRKRSRRPSRRLLPSIAVTRIGRHHPGARAYRAHHPFADQNDQRPGYQRRQRFPRRRSGRVIRADDGRIRGRRRDRRDS